MLFHNTSFALINRLLGNFTFKLIDNFVTPMEEADVVDELLL